MKPLVNGLSLKELQQKESDKPNHKSCQICNSFKHDDEHCPNSPMCRICRGLFHDEENCRF